MLLTEKVFAFPAPQETESPKIVVRPRGLTLFDTHPCRAGAACLFDMPRSTALYRNKEQLKLRLAELPASPGIYRFYDASDGLIYVGKSVRLRDRVRSYFTGKADTKKLRRLRQEISRIEWQETGSELEALLLESRLVKQHLPRFNVLLKGFTPLPYVRVDLRDPFPRLEITRAPERDGATYYGPFRRQEALEAGLGALEDSLQLRDCLTPGEKLPGTRPCYRHELGYCSAPCLGLIDSQAYRAAVESACGVFLGQEQNAVRSLQERMERAAERLQFEIAARLRDALRHIQAVSGRQQALTSAVQDLSLVAACPSRTLDALCLFVFRSGKLVLQETVPLAELQMIRARQEWAIRLVAAQQARDPDEKEGIDSALLDEIQIVTAWMKQKTREGEYWSFPRETGARECARALAEWLAEQAASAAETALPLAA